MQAHSLYLHIPFCHHRCGYCDFNTYAGMEGYIPAYVLALCNELEYIARKKPHKIPLKTIFFGGGTPSLLPEEEIDRILATIQREFETLDGTEISLEANPGQLDLEYLISIRQMGVNRISLGMQSANPDDLSLLERQHDFQQVKKAVELIRSAGFANLNLDLIFGIPYQSLKSFQDSLDLALTLEPEHFSLYALTIESGTPLESRLRKGMVPEPDPDLAAQMYEIADEKFILNGYEQYEISNWARKDSHGLLLACRHNLQYWRNLPYLGVGAGAHGYAAGMRTENELNPKKYIQVLDQVIGNSVENQLTFPQSPVTVAVNKIDRELEMKETMMMGLRLTREGVSSTAFKNRFGMELKDAFSTEIEELIAFGLLQWDSEPEEKLRLTEGGRLLGNLVFMRFV